MGRVRKQPTVEEMGDLFVKTLHEMDEVYLGLKARLFDDPDNLSVGRALEVFRKVYSNALAAGCELIGASEDDWECIFDVDRPKEEMKFWEHLELLGLPEGAD